MSATRHELGQWFTPESVADLALSLVLPGLPPNGRVLDPSCGDGVFLRRAKARGVAPECLIGVDIDASAIDAARVHLPKAELVHGDFFEETLDPVDLIVGNPPYVRQERLEPRAKARIADLVAKDWPQLERNEIDRLVGRSDLAAPFLLRALARLRPGGRAAMVVSTAFFDAGYGEQFWALLGQVASLQLVVTAPKERWFLDAAVNTVIAVFTSHATSEDLQVARLHVASTVAAKRLAAGDRLDEIACMRQVGRKDPKRWAASLRAPDAWFDFLAAGRAGMTTLGEVAEIRRGITSGANDIFYLPRERALALELPSQFLQPLLRAPGRGGAPCIEVVADECEEVVLVVPSATDLEAYPALKRYLESFESPETRTSLAARTPWWALRPRPAQVFFSKAYGERFVQQFSPEPIVADQRVYCVHPCEGVEPALLAAVLNCTMTALAIESLGRASMGAGALEWTVGDASNLPILDPRLLRNEEVLQAFGVLTRRTLGPVEAESQQADRVALDAAILEAWPHLRDSLASVTQALVHTVAERQARARGL